MNHRNQTRQKLASALLLAIAAGLAWGIAAVWCGYLFTQFFASRPQVYHTFDVADDGTPVTSTVVVLNRAQERLYRTLDGEPFDPKGKKWLSPGYFYDLLKPPGLFEIPISWSDRVAGLSDQLRPSAGWYLVRDAEPLGHAYFVGYDSRSNLCIGYIGRKGFGQTIPPRDEWFDLGRHKLNYGGGVLANTGYIQNRARAHEYPDDLQAGRLPTWLAFLIDGDRLLEIDLRARSVRTLYESPGMLSVAVVTEPSKGEDNKRAMPIARVALRTTDRIVVLDPPTGDKREFTLPKALQDKLMAGYVIGPEELLIHWSGETFGESLQLAWIKPDGSISREEKIVLTNQNQASEQAAAAMAAGVVPVPVGWLAAAGVVAPLERVQHNMNSTYADGLSRVLGPAWPALLAVIVVGIILAWLTYRLQRGYRRSATGAWTTFVLLSGLPGFFAYWLEHRWPKMESCNACGQVVPRDRDVCAACGRTFAPPPLVGTEIFA